MGYWLLVLIVCTFSQLKAEYEGTNTFRNYGKIGMSWLVQFLPYNPTIVEVGAFTGEETINIAKTWPYHKKIVAFEPNPRAFDLLQKKIEENSSYRIHAYRLAMNNYEGSCPLYLNRGPNGDDLAYENQSSLLPPSETMESLYKGVTLEVPCVVLEEWCDANEIDHIDILSLQVEGAELRLLQSSPNLLKNSHFIILQSFFYPFRKETTDYFALKGFLGQHGFTPLAHWYEPQGKGTAVYISNEMFNAYFVKCLGLGTGGLQYP